MSNTADFAQDFIARARTGNRVSVSLKRSHMEGFLKVLARHSVAVADICLSQLDPELRQIVLTLFFSTAAGSKSVAASSRRTKAEDFTPSRRVLARALTALASSSQRPLASTRAANTGSNSAHQVRQRFAVAIAHEEIARVGSDRERLLLQPEELLVHRAKDSPCARWLRRGGTGSTT